MVENATWVHGGATFATIHMVGADNNLGDDRREFDMRNTANIDRISATFRAAMETDGRGVVLIFHADIFSSQAPRSNFADAITAISTSAGIFDRPVLLINGDAHVYGIDHPIRDSRTGGNIQKITRAVVFGDTEMLVVRVFVNPTSPLLFDVEPLIIKKNMVD